jgi:hypothetical protein
MCFSNAFVWPFPGGFESLVGSLFLGTRQKQPTEELTLEELGVFRPILIQRAAQKSKGLALLILVAMHPLVQESGQCGRIGSTPDEPRSFQ